MAQQLINRPRNQISMITLFSTPGVSTSFRRLPKKVVEEKEKEVEEVWRGFYFLSLCLLKFSFLTGMRLPVRKLLRRPEQPDRHSPSPGDWRSKRASGGEGTPDCDYGKSDSGTCKPVSSRGDGCLTRESSLVGGSVWEVRTRLLWVCLQYF